MIKLVLPLEVLTQLSRFLNKLVELYLVLCLDSDSDLVSQLTMVNSNQLRLMRCKTEISQQSLSLVSLLICAFRLAADLSHLVKAADRLVLIGDITCLGLFPLFFNLMGLRLFLLLRVHEHVQIREFWSFDQEFVTLEQLCREGLRVVSC